MPKTLSHPKPPLLLMLPDAILPIQTISDMLLPLTKSDLKFNYPCLPHTLVRIQKQSEIFPKLNLLIYLLLLLIIITFNNNNNNINNININNNNNNKI